MVGGIVGGMDELTDIMSYGSPAKSLAKRPANRQTDRQTDRQTHLNIKSDRPRQTNRQRQTACIKGKKIHKRKK